MKSFVGALCFLLLLVAFVAGDVQLCTKVKDHDQCLSSRQENGEACTWCVSKAVPSLCCSEKQSQKLPPAVFQCNQTSTHQAPALGAPMDGCTLTLGFQCAAVIANCVAPCAVVAAPACLNCIGTSLGMCCPCLKQAFGNGFPC